MNNDKLERRPANERSILHLIRRFGPLAKADLSRFTGLSAQGASVIVNRMLENGLLAKKSKLRGRIGQPSTPYGLNPDGAYAIGVKVGAREICATLINFSGHIVTDRSAALPDLKRDTVHELMETVMHDIIATLPDYQHQRLVGVGIATPPTASLCRHEWDPGYLQAAATRITGRPAFVAHDAVAACSAEMTIGRGLSGTGLYIMFGAYTSGATVVAGELPQKHRRCLGDFPLFGPFETAKAQKPRNLLEAASLRQLETALAEAGLDTDCKRASVDPNHAIQRVYAQWSDGAVKACAFAIVAASALLPIKRVVIDGALPAEPTEAMITAISKAVRAEIGQENLPDISIGGLGEDALTIGGALLPFHDVFAPDTLRDMS